MVAAGSLGLASSAAAFHSCEAHYPTENAMNETFVRGIEEIDTDNTLHA